MKRMIRRVVGTGLAACVVAGLTVSGAGLASAKTTASATSADACTIDYDDGSASTVPTARKPGVRLREWIPVHNHQSVVIPNVYVYFVTSGDVQRRAPLPSVWWRVAGGQWKRARLTWAWNSPTAPHTSQWLSSNLELGNLGPRATKWIEVDTYFPAHSIKGAYYQLFLDRSHACSPAANLDMYQAGLEYWPWHGLEGHPA